MGFSPTTGTANRMRAPRWPAGLVPWRKTVETFLEKIAKASGVQVEIIGADSAATGADGKTTFKVTAGAGADADHPFKVAHMGGDDFRVSAGSIDGETMDEETVDVGATRPCALVIKPEYSLSIWNSQHVWASSIKSGADAPTFAANSSNLSDIGVVTSSGTEAQCVIATIDSDNVVTQIATGNITSDRDDDGSLSGQLAVTFNK